MNIKSPLKSSLKPPEHYNSALIEGMGYALAHIIDPLLAITENKLLFARLGAFFINYANNPSLTVDEETKSLLAEHFPRAMHQWLREHQTTNITHQPSACLWQPHTNIDFEAQQKQSIREQFIHFLHFTADEKKNYFSSRIPNVIAQILSDKKDSLRFIKKTNEYLWENGIHVIIIRNKTLIEAQNGIAWDVIIDRLHRINHTIERYQPLTRNISWQVLLPAGSNLAATNTPEHITLQNITKLINLLIDGALIDEKNKNFFIAEYRACENVEKNIVYFLELLSKNCQQQLETINAREEIALNALYEKNAELLTTCLRCIATKKTPELEKAKKLFIAAFHDILEDYDECHYKKLYLGRILTYLHNNEMLQVGKLTKNISDELQKLFDFYHKTINDRHYFYKKYDSGYLNLTKISATCYITAQDDKKTAEHLLAIETEKNDLIEKSYALLRECELATDAIDNFIIDKGLSIKKLLHCNPQLRPIRLLKAMATNGASVKALTQVGTVQLNHIKTIIKELEENHKRLEKMCNYANALNLELPTKSEQYPLFIDYLTAHEIETNNAKQAISDQITAMENLLESIKKTAILVENVEFALNNNPNLSAMLGV